MLELCCFVVFCLFGFVCSDFLLFCSWFWFSWRERWGAYSWVSQSCGGYERNWGKVIQIYYMKILNKMHRKHPMTVSTQVHGKLSKSQNSNRGARMPPYTHGLHKEPPASWAGHCTYLGWTKGQSQAATILSGWRWKSRGYSQNKLLSHQIDLSTSAPVDGTITVSIETVNTENVYSMESKHRLLFRKRLV